MQALKGHPPMAPNKGGCLGWELGTPLCWESSVGSSHAVWAAAKGRSATCSRRGVSETGGGGKEGSRQMRRQAGKCSSYWRRPPAQFSI